MSPILANIMLHEFDAWLEANYLSDKARKDRGAWNFGIQQARPVAVRENRQRKPAVAYCRYADDFVVIVKGNRAQAETIREECRAFLEGRLKLTLNMEKTHITHVDDGFVFLGHRIIRKRGSHGRLSVVTTIPKEKAKTFARRLVEALSGNHEVAPVDMIDSLNRQLTGWATFYKFTDFHSTHVPAHRHRRVLAAGALVGAEIPDSHQATDAQMEPRSREQSGKDLADLWSKQQRQSCQEGAAPAGDKPKGAVPVAKSGTEPVHRSG